jgi:hypothetical protein
MQMNHRLDLNLLPIAVALYEERHVSRTATRLGMSQPAVSGALARLRKAFDGSPVHPHRARHGAHAAGPLGATRFFLPRVSRLEQWVKRSFR